MDKIRWGIIGTGNIAHQFAGALNTISDVEIGAVLATSQAKADQFAFSFDIPHAFDNVDHFFEQSGVNVVYIATPHTHHYTFAQTCLEQGIAVLCEKPLTVNYQQSLALVALAKARGTFFMEAMMIPMFPAIHSMMTLILEGIIGEVKSVQAGMGFNAPRDWESRVFNPALAGGALLDVGIYPLTFVQMIAQTMGSNAIKPESIVSEVELAPTGVDMQSTAILRYANGLVATVSSSVGHYIPCQATVLGDKGMIEIPDFSFGPKQLIVRDQVGQIIKVLEVGFQGSAYVLEAEHVHDCLRNQYKESPRVPHQQTLAVMAIMDELRAQWQLRYPGE
ncbi:Gfo/Idh/MocA family protein [Thaumasiovibrio subtropicus]|uniref:Gfo/Idh/MocA family protein n=1 Tax=Thaumasiovibrio subtropicus TaxID=1891207 RepID=UPI000B35A229|nr:Gfo/Idh/MocA family oxidoreductase [Thaumasiovibrio subtropicus]